MHKITVWSKRDPKTGEWIHNHFDYGHNSLDQTHPIGTPMQTHAWAKKKWKAEHMHLTDDCKAI